MVNPVIVYAQRTPIAKFQGSFASTTASLLGSQLVNDAVTKTALPKEMIDEIIMGQVLTGGSGQNPARQASIMAGIPIEKSALTINQVCGSGLRAISAGAQSIMTEQSKVVIAGGQESMSNDHHSINLRNG